MALLETPSRIWRRIEAIEGRDMPSLPSLPAYDDSAESGGTSSSLHGDNDDDLIHLSDDPPFHSTPATVSSHTTTMRAALSSNSTARFATSIASRSTNSAMSTSRATSTKEVHTDSFDVSVMPSLPNVHHDENDEHIDDMEITGSAESVPDIYLPPEEDQDRDDYEEEGLYPTETPQPITRRSPSFSDENPDGTTSYKDYDYSVSLRSEPKPSPFKKFRNVSFRRPIARARTPSLSRTTPSPDSSSVNSTPQSSQSVQISPAIMVQAPHELSSGEDIVSSDHARSFRQTQDRDERSMEDVDRRSLIHPDDADILGQEDSQKDSKDETGGESRDDREPTFSDTGPMTTSQSHNIVTHRPPGAPLSSLFSPAPSSVFTPTPAFPSRPRPQINVPTSLQTPSQPKPASDDDESATPFARRRSFLLSVINSETRPRPKFATPHPRPTRFKDHSITQEDGRYTPGTNLLTAFAGVTPRPAKRARPSHPLSQTYIASPETPVSTVPAAHSDPKGAKVLPRWSLSPVEEDRASFISTTSSHDLTTHYRMNTSFDPVMGLGAQGHGVGRFNAGKLNAYLHGLNRRLQEENEVLMQRLTHIEAVSATGEGFNVVPGSRRVSMVGSALGDVEEDVSGEGWVEEKAELEKMVDAFREEVQKCTIEREAIETALEEERQERTRDKERWKARMTEVEKGVEGIITDLECRITDAEKHTNEIEAARDTIVKELGREITEIKAERDTALERVQRAEQMLENGRELGGELRDANERVGKLMADLRNANVQVKELEEDALRSYQRVEQVETELQNERQLRKKIEDERQTRSRELLEMQNDLRAIGEKLRLVDIESREARKYAEALEDDAGLAVERIQNLEGQLKETHSNIKTIALSEMQVVEKSKKLEAEIERNAELNRQMEEALEAAEQKMSEDEEQIADLRAKVTAMQRQRDQEVRDQKSAPHMQSQAGPTEEELEELEEELERANREIGRLNMLLHQSPARKAIEKAKDTKVEMLEMEKEELLERIQALKATLTEVATPNKLINPSTMSSIHRQNLSIALKTPRTPGGPLRDLSWLNNTVADPTVAPLLAEITRLQRELDRANENIDDKLDRLGEAGLGVVNLTKKLDDARLRIVALEENIARLSRREDRRIRRLERARCQKCHGRVDLRALDRAAEGDESSLDISRATIRPDPPTPPTRTSEALRADLRSAIAQLDQLKKKWLKEKNQLLGQNAALQDAAKKLNAEVLNAKDEVKRVVQREKTGVQKKAGVQEELERAKATIVDLEVELKAERARLRSFTMEQHRIQQDKKGVMLQLQRTESDIEDVKGKLQSLKRENLNLELQLQVNAGADQKARTLEKKVAENAQTIERLRQERSLLAKDHKDLQCHFTEISEQANRLRDQVATTQTAHDNRRHQLDLYVVEIEDLRRALSDQADELQRTEAEKKRIAAEKGDVVRTVTTLEADLERVRKDARTFGQDLRTLRIEKEKLEAKHKEERSKLERARKQCEAQIKRLNEELATEQGKTTQAKAELQNHVCVIDDKGLSAMKLQHNKECKGLMVQIRYLKAKYTRETGFRSALGYQKQYLLTLLSVSEKSEQTIIAALARIGFPTRPPAPASKGRSLKSVALSVVFILRAKHASDLWQEQRTVRQDIVDALQEVRQRRVANP